MALTDRQIVQRWAKRQEAKRQINALKARVEKLDEPIIAELKSRGTKRVENNGRHVTLVEGETLEIDEDGLIEFLRKSKKGRELLPRVTKLSVDKTGLLAEVKAGNVPNKVFQRFATMKPKKAYLDGSGD